MVKSEMIEFLESIEGDPVILFLTGHGDTIPTQHDIQNAELNDDGNIYLYSWLNSPEPRPIAVVE